MKKTHLDSFCVWCVGVWAI